jgi:cyclopropane-fatty-acyl-phospholipid synthase
MAVSADPQMADRRSRGRTVAQHVGPVLDGIAGGALRRRRLAITFWDGSCLGAGGERADTRLVVRDPRALLHLLHEPNQVGLARAWVSGALDAEADDDLDSVLEAITPQEPIALSWADRRRSTWAAWRLLGRDALRAPGPLDSEARVDGQPHSLGRDRQAVRPHYDWPTEFYALLLGPTMTYSCAYFRAPGEALEAAQRRKLDVICRKLRLRPGDQLLDIGCGWGELVVHAAQRYGAYATGVTVSIEQAAAARERIASAGLSHSCDVVVADYREIGTTGFDAVASVGMYEHVGRVALDGYVAQVRRMLRPGGRFLNHGIVRLRDAAPNDRRFIDRFVFPDGELTHLDELLGALRGWDLEVRDVEALREHYVLTLRAWLDRLEAHRDEAIALVGAERERIWRLYMTAAARAFALGEIGVMQTLAVRGGAEHRLGLVRPGYAQEAA